MDRVPVSNPGHHLPRFHLRGLFALITGLAAAFTLLGSLGPAASMAVVLLGSLVALHVAGNALGTSLNGGAPRNDGTAALPVRPKPRIPAPGSLPRLYQRSPLSRIIPAASLAGGAAGAAWGSMLLQGWTRASTSGIVLGSVSFGLLGALFGFLAGSFLEMALGAWWQASSHENLDRCRDTKSRLLLPRLRTDVPAALIAEFDAG